MIDFVRSSIDIPGGCLDLLFVWNTLQNVNQLPDNYVDSTFAGKHEDNKRMEFARFGVWLIFLEHM